eukprot:6925970-Alexandrium_andersonii.AAC.1
MCCLEGGIAAEAAAAGADARQLLEKLVADHGIADRPFVVCLRGFVPEVLMLYREKDGDKNKDVKVQGADKQVAFGFKKGGHPARKLAAT